MIIEHEQGHHRCRAPAVIELFVLEYDRPPDHDALALAEEGAGVRAGANSTGRRDT